MFIKNNKPIIVLGMHRSGTSCLAGSLEKSGVYFGDVSQQNKYNLKGNRENLNIVTLNDKILNHNHGSWDNPPLEIKWTKGHEIEGQSIINQFESSKNRNPWGFKDPRTLLTFPFWSSLLPNINLVGTIRSPYNVALSLKTRDNNFSVEDGLQLWFHYNQILLRLLNEQSFPLISFDTDNQSYKEKLNQIKKSLSLNNDIKDDFFEKKLRSHTAAIHERSNEKVDQCYSKLTKFLS